MSPVFQSRNVPFWEGNISTFGEGGCKACTPGMVRSRFEWQSFFLESQIQLFGRNDFGLLGLLVVNGEGQGFAIIQDRDVVLRIHTHSDLGIAQCIGGSLGLDLVNGLLELEGQIFGEGPCFLPGEDGCEIFFGGEGAMQIHIAARGFGKALVEICQEFR
jgi:hypothetical protein